MLEVVLLRNEGIDHITLVNNINSLGQNIRLFKILKDIDEVLKLIEINSIDILLIDYKTFKKLDILQYSQLTEKLKYIIVFTTKEIKENDYNNKNFTICNFENLIDVLKKYLDKNLQYNFTYDITENNIRAKINKEVAYLGYNPAYNGTKYLIDCIYYLYKNDNDYKENTVKDIYSILSQKYKKSENTIKGNITRATSIMFCECEEEKLKKYLGICYLPKTGSKVIMQTILNKLSYMY